MEGRLGILRANLLLLALLMAPLHAGGKKMAIYGSDNRAELLQAESEFAQLALSTLAQIPSWAIWETLDPDIYEIRQPLGTRRYPPLCPKEKFSREIHSATCSGFLVAPDLVLTAGHCVSSESHCQNRRWVFDYHAPSPENFSENVPESLPIPKSSVYSCASIEEFSAYDYAVVRLDRPVLDRPPLDFRREGTLADGARFVVIGHPLGGPTKIDDGGGLHTLRRNHPEEAFFMASLDTFTGSSGSPVFNLDTGLVEGILIRGERDFSDEREDNCQRLRQCSQENCRGEVILRIGRVKMLSNL